MFIANYIETNMIKENINNKYQEKMKTEWKKWVNQTKMQYFCKRNWIFRISCINEKKEKLFKIGVQKHKKYAF